MAAEIVIRGLRSGEAAIATVDEKAAPILSRSAWHLGTDGYARRKATRAERRAGAPFHVAMHRQILGLCLIKGRPGDLECDHVNRNRLDNRQVSHVGTG